MNTSQLRNVPSIAKQCTGNPMNLVSDDLENQTYMALENKKLGPRVGPKIQFYYIILHRWTAKVINRVAFCICQLTN